MEGRKDQRIFHGALSHQIVIELLYQLFRLIDRCVDTDHVLIFLVDDRIQSDLGLSCLLISDDELSLSKADGVDQVDTCDSRI